MMFRHHTPRLDRFTRQQEALGFDSARQDMIDLAEALKGDLVDMYERLQNDMNFLRQQIPAPV